MREIRVGFKVLKGPEAEPVTVDDLVPELDGWLIKPSLKHLIPAARRRAEAETGRLIGEQTVLMTLDRFPSEHDETGDVLPLPHSPVLGVESICYLDERGALYGLGALKWRFSNIASPVLMPAVEMDWPAVLHDTVDAVRITYRAGEPADEGVKEAVRMIALYWYTHQGEAMPPDEMGLARIPVAALALLQGS